MIQTIGKQVQITDLSGKDYYQIEYQINDTQGQWTKIKSGDITEVGYSSTIYARLVYGPNKGKIHPLSIEAKAPVVTAKNIDTSNYIRKSEIAFSDLFEITWGSDGTGTVEYSILGNLNFKNTNFSSTQITNISELEVGNYEVTCKITSPSNKTATAAKDNVKVTRLANTTVANENNNPVNANAIYSEYDLAYFRDLVNGGQFTINGKLMNDIDLSKVCSVAIGSWIPIGDDNGAVEHAVPSLYYHGILEGNNHKILNVYINVEKTREGLLGYNKGIVRNLSIENGFVKSTQNQIGLLVGVNEGIIRKIITKGNVNTGKGGGGIAGNNTQGGKIELCINEATISYNVSPSVVNYGDNIGGIIGINYFNGTIEKCINHGTITGSHKAGGIAGGLVAGEINESINYGKIVGNVEHRGAGTYIGGIVAQSAFKGGGRAIVRNCINAGELASEDVNNNYTGGIVGTATGGSMATEVDYSLIENCYNIGKISSKAQYAGGIIGGTKDGLGTSEMKNNYWLDTCGVVWGRAKGKTNTKAEKETAEQLKNLSNTLGTAYVADSTMINSGYPILKWQLEK